MGYVARSYFEQVEQGQTPDVAEHLFLHRLTQGESAENGISSNEDGAVILTNKSCYMLNADNGVQIKWKVDYETNGANDAQEDSGYTGGGLAYGGGSTPTLTRDLVLFTDNADPVNLIVVSSKTGEVVVKTPVLDKLGEGVPVSVENSILVYSAGEERTSVLVCNWFGAGNAALSDPDSDSSVQSYDALYDKSWIAEGNRYIAPGVQRVDVVKEGDSYNAEYKWLRADLRDTSMIKLSTATGYLYGYWQDLDTGMWCFGVLDFETGETVLQEDVSSLAAYNNMAVGMIADVRGNTLYCPTNNMDIVRWQDRFVSLPEIPAKEIDPNDMERYHLTDEAFQKLSGTNAHAASFLMRVKLGNIPEGTSISFRLNGLEGTVAEHTLYYRAADGSLKPFEGAWDLIDGDGKTLAKDAPCKRTHCTSWSLSLKITRKWMPPPKPSRSSWPSF